MNNIQILSNANELRTKIDLLRETLEQSIKIIGRCETVIEVSQKNPFPFAMGKETQREIEEFKKHINEVFTPENIGG